MTHDATAGKAELTARREDIIQTCKNCLTRWADPRNKSACDEQLHVPEFYESILVLLAAPPVPSVGAAQVTSMDDFTQGVLFAANFLEREADANFMPNEPAKVLLKGMASALRINMRASGLAAAAPKPAPDKECA